MITKSSCILGVEDRSQSLHEPDAACILVNQQQNGIHGEVSSLKIDFELLVAFESDGA